MYRGAKEWVVMAITNPMSPKHSGTTICRYRSWRLSESRETKKATIAAKTNGGAQRSKEAVLS